MFMNVWETQKRLRGRGQDEEDIVEEVAFVLTDIQSSTKFSNQAGGRVRNLYAS